MRKPSDLAKNDKDNPKKSDASAAPTEQSSAPEVAQQGVFVVHDEHGKLKVVFVPVKTASPAQPISK